MKIELQDIFNAAWEHFIVGNGKPSVNPKGDSYNCMYRSKDGNKCAIGLVIPDDMAENFENSRFSALVAEVPSFWGDSVKSLSKDSLNLFQFYLHDNLIHNGEWAVSKKDHKEEYIRIANIYNLEVPRD